MTREHTRPQNWYKRGDAHGWEGSLGHYKKGPTKDELGERRDSASEDATDD